MVLIKNRTNQSKWGMWENSKYSKIEERYCTDQTVWKMGARDKP